MSLTIELVTLLISTVVVMLLVLKLHRASSHAQHLYRALSLELEKRTSFWGGAAHDLKHPLSAINLRAQLIERKLDSGLGRAEIANGLAEIRACAHEMGDLIEEMQDAAQMQMGMTLELMPEPVDLMELTSSLSAQVCARTGRSIRVEARTQELTGSWDPARLRRVLGNLLSNALKYSPPESEVRIVVECDAQWALVRVQDDGIGIPQAEQKLVFDQFFRGTNVRRKFYGTGLGLAGSKQIVEQHGGTIEVQSVEGSGSTFTVRLPRTAPLPAGGAAMIRAACGMPSSSST